MKEKIKIDPNGPAVTAEIRFVYASVGVYWAWLFGADDQDPVRIAKGLSDDDVPDVFTLASADTLVGRAVSIRADVASLVMGTTPVGIIVDVFQGQNRVGSLAPPPVNVTSSQRVPFLLVLRFES